MRLYFAALFLAFFVYNVLHVVKAQAQWIPSTFYTASTSASVSPSDVVLDELNNLYITGSFTDTLHFPGLEQSLISSGGTDIFLAKLNSQLQVEWALRAGGAAEEGCWPTAWQDTGRSILLDEAGHLYLTGDFASEADFDGDGIPEVTSEASCNFYLAKYNTQGQLLWVTTAGRSEVDKSSKVLMNVEGEVILAGHYREDIDIDDDGTINAEDMPRIFVDRYNTAGELIDRITVGNIIQDGQFGYAFNADLARGLNGNLYVSGQYGGTLFIENSNPQSFSCDLDFLPCTFIIKYDAAGNVVWLTNLPEVRYFNPLRLAVDTQGNLHFASNAETELIVSKINPAGELIWQRETRSTFIPHDHGSGPGVLAHRVTVAPDGSLLVLGSVYHAETDFDEDDAPDITAPFRLTFLARYDVEGSLIHVYPLVHSAADYNNNAFINSFTLSHQNEPVVLGRFNGTVQLDPFSEDTITAANDLLIVKYDNDTPPLPVALTSFTATADGSDVTLSWQTASETNNAGFEILHEVPGQSPLGIIQDSPHQLLFIPGAGTTTEPKSYTYRIENLTPGTHTFQLKQIDFNGTFSLSNSISLTIGVDTVYQLSDAFPNPFNPRSSFSLTVAQSQEVEIVLYDMLGRRVQHIFKGILTSNVPQQFVIHGSRLPSGTYVYQVQGEHFLDKGQITLLK